MSRGDLSEGEWRTLQAALPVARTGRPPNDLRQTINGILWRIRTGTPWRDVPEKYGKWMTVYQRFRRWSQTGVWEAIATTLAQAMADNRHHSIDSTTVRGHVSAAGAKGGLANRLSRLPAAQIRNRHLIRDGQRELCRKSCFVSKSRRFPSL